MDERVLMILRERSGQTCWELPSGLTEQGESPEQTAIRKKLEEVGVWSQAFQAEGCDIL